MARTDLNLTTYEERMTVMGVGQHRATDMIKLREGNGFLQR